MPDVFVAQRSAAVSTGCTGLRVWSSALLLGAELAKAPEALKGCSVVELGCGCGLAGIVAAACGASVVLTDRDADCLQLVAVTAGANAAAICDAGGSIAFTALDWEYPTCATTCSPLRYGATDVVIASDPLYTTTGAITLPRAAKALLAPHGKLLCLIGVREATGGQATLTRFLAESYASGLELIGDLRAVASSTISADVAKTYWTDDQLTAETACYVYLEMCRRAPD
jgi:predicted nicotinamide N-methyase